MKKLLTILFLGHCQHIFAQNLVPNSSFEDANICEQHQPCSPSAWFYITKNAVAGYFQNYIPAATGERWLSIVSGNRKSIGGRQYWQTMLLRPMEKGKTYRVTVSIRGWDDGPNVNDIGIYFIPRMVFYKPDTVIQPATYLKFSDAKITQQKNGWFKLEKEYIAISNDQCMMLGNFSKDNYQEIAKRRHSKSIYIGFLVDDIAISPIEKNLCEGCNELKDSLYEIVTRHSLPDTVAVEHILDSARAIESKPDTVSLDGIYFGSASYTISNPESLEQYRAIFTRHTISKIKIAGYTDDIGSIESNQQLSLKRAREVGKWLKLYFGIPSSMIIEEGLGISQHNLNKSKNRRVEVYIYYKSANN